MTVPLFNYKGVTYLHEKTLIITTTSIVFISGVLMIERTRKSIDSKVISSARAELQRFCLIEMETAGEIRSLLSHEKAIFVVVLVLSCCLVIDLYIKFKKKGNLTTFF